MNGLLLPFREKKSPYLKEWMTQADLPKQSSMLERMNDRPQLLSSNMTHYFEEWTTAKVF